MSYILLFLCAKLHSELTNADRHFRKVLTLVAQALDILPVQ